MLKSVHPSILLSNLSFSIYFLQTRTHKGLALVCVCILQFQKMCLKLLYQVYKPAFALLGLNCDSFFRYIKVCHCQACSCNRCAETHTKVWFTQCSLNLVTPGAAWPKFTAPFFCEGDQAGTVRTVRTGSHYVHPSSFKRVYLLKHTLQDHLRWVTICSF